MEAPKQYTIANHFLTVLAQQAIKQGLDLHQLLRDAGIAEELINQPHARIATNQLSRLIQVIWHELQDEHMGFLPHQAQIGTFHMMGRLAVHRPNLGKALQMAIRFYDMVVEDYRLNLTIGEHDCSFSIEVVNPEQNVEHIISEFCLGTWHRFACWLIGKEIVLNQAHFTYPPPPHVDEYKFIFPCSHEFSSGSNRLCFSRDYLQHPIVQNEDSLKEFIRQSPGNLLLSPRDDTSFTTRIRLLIEPYLEQGFPDFDRVATEMHTSNQTLRRKLKTEGTSYQQINDLVRRDHAIYHLTQQSLSVAEISRLVGFTEPGAFIRAFKGWTGVTPGDYRNMP